MVLRITKDEESHTLAVLRIEGRVVAEEAALLERECSALLQTRGAVSLDLMDVSFVDRAGIEALRRLSRAGVEIRCRSGPLASVLEGEDVHVTLNAEDVDDGRS